MKQKMLFFWFLLFTSYMLYGAYESNEILAIKASVYDFVKSTIGGDIAPAVALTILDYTLL